MPHCHGRELTYMSIHEVLKDHVGCGRLIHVTPLFPGASLERLVYANPVVFQQLDPATADDELAESSGHLRGWLDNFTRGRRIVVGPRRSKNVDMKLLVPEVDEVWEIRKRDAPSARIFGHFLERDVFVALGARSVTALFSDVWLSKSAVEILPIWNQEIRNCKARWRALFATYRPHSGERISDYLTSATDERAL